ncbi:hypothetical protein LSAT2_007954 [Lamellibrachia satsuma]|nr:hypothetical protein LSAT2_007954 [Lamellibrachia satsuma]
MFSTTSLDPDNKADIAIFINTALALHHWKFVGNAFSLATEEKARGRSVGVAAARRKENILETASTRLEG